MNHPATSCGSSVIHLCHRKEPYTSHTDSDQWPPMLLQRLRGGGGGGKKQSKQVNAYYSVYLSVDFPRESAKILSLIAPSSGCPHAVTPVCPAGTWPANLGLTGDERKLPWLQSDPSLAPLQAALVNAFP